VKVHTAGFHKSDSDVQICSSASFLFETHNINLEIILTWYIKFVMWKISLDYNILTDPFVVMNLLLRIYIIEGIMWQSLFFWSSLVETMRYMLKYRGIVNNIYTYA